MKSPDGSEPPVVGESITTMQDVAPHFTKNASAMTEV
jgi:hypothetical protein